MAIVSIWPFDEKEAQTSDLQYEFCAFEFISFFIVFCVFLLIISIFVFVS